MNSPRINIRNLPYLNEAADVFDESIAGQVIARIGSNVLKVDIFFLYSTTVRYVCAAMVNFFFPIQMACAVRPWNHAISNKNSVEIDKK